MKTSKLHAALRLCAVTVFAGAMGVAMANEPKGQEGGRDKMTERESTQPVDDTWITTKVKADLLATKDVSGLDLNVETVDGVVSLSGNVETQAEHDRAVAVAKAIKGVKRVDHSGITVGSHSR